MDIRLAEKSDLEQLLPLYSQLHDSMPIFDKSSEKIWDDILRDKNHYVIAGLIDNKIVSSCVILIVPNLTYYGRPYALIENVITDESYRGNGYAAQCLDYAREIAKENRCYKPAQVKRTGFISGQDTTKMIRQHLYNGLINCCVFP